VCTVLIHVLPLALGAAVSPAVLATSLEVLIAFGKRGRAMLLLYFVGAAAVVAAVLGLAAFLPQRSPTKGDTLISDLIDIVLGALLLVLAIVLLVRHPKPKQNDQGQRMLGSRWAGLAVLGLAVFMMATNFSTLVLLLAGAHEVRSAATGPVEPVLGYGMLAVGALLPILLPLVWALISPASATRVLQRLNSVLARHAKAIGVVLCALTAAYLLARGFGLI
jgi:hypothetical protein